MGDCYFCHRPASETHHMIHGSANRKIADKYGLTVDLCGECHRRLHGKNGKEMDWQLKQTAQVRFENVYGHDAWMEVVRRNYLDA